MFYRPKDIPAIQKEAEDAARPQEVKSAESAMDRALRLERAMLSMPQVDCPIRHHFAPGIYAREISIPAGTVVVGVVHKTDNLIIVSMGRLRIVTDEGTEEVCAGDTITCKAGTKNAVLALENSRWTNLLPNPNNITDTAQLVELFTFAKETELLGGANNKQLAANAAQKGSASCHLQQ